MRTDDMINLLVQDLPTPAPNVRGFLLRWWPVAAVVSGFVFLAIAGVRPDLLTAGFGPTLMKGILGAVLALVAITGALRLARPDAHANATAKWLIAVAICLSLIVAADLVRHGLVAWQARLFGKGVLPCLTLIPVLAALPLVASLTALRRGATTAPMATGALAGLASGGLAILAYGLFCNEDSPLFVATWYSLAVLIAATAGAVLGRAVLKW